MTATTTRRRASSKRRTAADRQAQAKELQASIVEQVEAMRDSDQWREFLDFAQAFHAYSFNNVMLILSQNPHATQVAGFRKWQELGRQVRKGEKSLKIFGFRQRRVKADEADESEDAETNDKGEKVITYFPVLSVFDVSQTDPIDPDADDPAEIAHRLTGDDPAGIGAAVTDWITGQGWTVRTEAIPGETNGYTDQTAREIVIDADLSPAQAAKTAIHETAHALMHEDLSPAEYQKHRGIAETEAESVAYIVAGVFGLDTADYSVGYVAGWSQCDTDLIRETAARVLTTARKVIEAVTPTIEPEDA